MGWQFINGIPIQIVRSDIIVTADSTEITADNTEITADSDDTI